MNRTNVLLAVLCLFSFWNSCSVRGKLDDLRAQVDSVEKKTNHVVSNSDDAKLALEGLQTTGMLGIQLQLPPHSSRDHR